MKILCNKAYGDKNNRIACTVLNGLCKHQRYCTMKKEWQNTDSFSICERRNKSMAKKKNLPIDDLTDIDTIETTSDNFIEEDASMKTVDTFLEAIESEDDKVVKVEAVKESNEVKPLRQGRVLMYLGNDTIIETPNGNITINGRIGKKGRLVEF